MFAPGCTAHPTPAGGLGHAAIRRVGEVLPGRGTLFPMSQNWPGRPTPTVIAARAPSNTQAQETPAHRSLAEAV